MRTFHHQRGGSGSESPRAAAATPWRGVMLLEMLLALAITALLGVGVAGIILMTGQNAATRNDMQESLVRLGLLTSRINASIRECGTILARDNNSLLLWSADVRPDGVPNLSELRLIERNPQTQELGQSVISLPAGLTDEQLQLLDTGYPLSTDFTALIGQLKAGGNFLYTPWGQHLSEWAIELDEAVPMEASLVGYRLNLNVGLVNESIVSSARLRNR
jgi:hypothetical protein